MGSRSIPNPVPLATALEAVEALGLARHRFVSLTGGEPLLQPEAVGALAEALRGRGPRLFLETHGLHAEALGAVIHLLDVVSMDWKLPSEVRGPGWPFYEAHARFLAVARKAPEVVVKIVVTAASQDAEIEEAVARIAAQDPAIPLVLQPVTPFGPVQERPGAGRLLELLEPPAAAVCPAPPPAREPLRRRAVLGLGRLWQWGEVLLDRLVSPQLNPLYHTGTIAVFSLAVATVTGIYLFVFYRVGTEAAHRSVEEIMAQPWGIGALMRSLHRYASDAAILAAALHGLKMFLNDRFWGPRWIGWVSGLALLGLLWITSATGYWLVWDMQAQVLSVTTARLLDVLPVFGEPLGRTFLDAGRIQNFLFFLVLFIHITIPLLLGAAYWIHVMRLSRARFLPPRVVLWVTGLALVGASLLRPALSGPPADLGRLPGVTPVDWFYFFYFPLTALDPRAGWALLVGVGLLALSVPWALRGRALPRARVEAPACTGCTRCWKDCPYEAIVMLPREDDTRYKQVAVVHPAKCVGCGICVGACDSAGIVLGDTPVSLLGEAVQARLRALAARRPAGPVPVGLQARRRAPDPTPTAAAAPAPVLVYACRLMQTLAPRLGPDGTLPGLAGVTLMGLPCVGMLHPEMIGKSLEAGAAGVFVAGCVPEDCPYREGSLWLAERLSGQRLPALKDVPEDRLRVRWYSPVEVGRFVRDVAAFQRDLGRGA
jgi:organic radical activating enzyme/coenzyme F420-reducing hydrogenase delta subunit/ferredoxin